MEEYDLKLTEFDKTIKECEKFILDFDSWFNELKDELEKEGYIIGRYSSGFAFISDIYGK